MVAGKDSNLWPSGYEADARLCDGLLPIAIKCYGVWFPKGSCLNSIVTICYWMLWFVMADDTYMDT